MFSCEAFPKKELQCQNFFWEVSSVFDSGFLLALAELRFLFTAIIAKLSQAMPQLQLSWLALASLKFT